jgi:hypothetical protein
MVLGKQTHGLMGSFLLILTHGVITLLAVLIAFSLPPVAQYILYQWWPKVETEPNLLLATEIVLASILVLLFNGAQFAWANRKWVRTAKLAALVYARPAGNAPRWRERALVRRLPAARDAFVLTLTGYDTFIDKRSLLREVLEKAYEIRVLLLNPLGEGLRRRVEALPPDITALSYHGEIEASITYLAELRKRGKAVTLKFYDHEPFWKIVVLGEHVWVQHCHSGVEVKQQPEYVFALAHRNPRGGLFVPFYMHFLNQWGERHHPEYDFDTGELVYRDMAGKETRRAPLGVPINGNLAAGPVTDLVVEVAAPEVDTVG